MQELLANGIQFIKGVGSARAEALSRLGIITVGDMLYFFPRSLEDRSRFNSISELVNGENVCVRAKACPPVQEVKLRNNLTVYNLIIRDGPFIAVASWFNNKFVKNAFVAGEMYDFYGKATVKFGKREISNPVYEKADKNTYTGRVVPIYPLTADLSQKTIQSVAKSCVDIAMGNIIEYLPNSILQMYTLCEINYAISSIHFPKTLLDYHVARRRFVFEELLILQLGLFMIKGQRSTGGGNAFGDASFVNEFYSRLPFEPTNAQKRAVNEIVADVSTTKPMSRLVQGDVGSGKTVVAFAVIFTAVKNGFQAALMAPTEILAMQHFRSACELLPDLKIELLTGSTSKKNKISAIERLKNGEADFVIGTHALIEDGVQFDRLALVVTDEQHRFGVRQRARLASKGISPHILVMSATPIPRTLALILYGDLDISVVNEMPPGRQKIDTYVVGEDMRQRIYNFIKKQLDEGRQAYIVCPLVEESETLDIKAATELEKQLQEVLLGYSVGLLHGRMKPSEKDEIMSRFSQGDVQALVSTTVIEVGVNVPNATIMVVENAERFGLSQLHQLRGRVGRGVHKSYCILFNGGGEASKKRLDIMAKTGDGFVISQKDLELRGPGDFLGTRQHGLPNLKIADIGADMEILKQVQQAAQGIIRVDPKLENDENKPLKERLLNMFADTFDNGRMN